MTMTPEMQTLKSRLKAMWMAGDYGHFAKYLEPGAMAFFPSLQVAPGERVLDVACGAGQLSLPAARAGADVAGVDIATNLIEQAQSRAQAEGLSIRFEEGDAEDLPYDDEAFDLVFSLIGAMFAPRPEQVATELVRACRPGGTGMRSPTARGRGRGATLPSSRPASATASTRSPRRASWSTSSTRHRGRPTSRSPSSSGTPTGGPRRRTVAPRRRRRRRSRRGPRERPLRQRARGGSGGGERGKRPQFI